MKIKLQKKSLKALANKSDLNHQATPQVGGGVVASEWCSRGLKCIETQGCYSRNLADCILA